MTDVRTRAADTLRAWALDENLKRRIMSDPALAAIASRAAKRYSAGKTIDEAIATARRAMGRGHAVSLEYVGESVRDARVADAETEVFLQLVARVQAEDLPATVSADLTHLGALVDPQQGLRNAGRIAAALADQGRTFMISAEGSERSDLVLDLYEQLVREHGSVGITIQARLHRSEADLERVLALPGPVRLVKGAFLESHDVALPRESPELFDRYLRLAGLLIASGHATAIATHDGDLLHALIERMPEVRDAAHVEFEMLLGLGAETLDRLHAEGYRTRVLSNFGGEWWLYVLNRIAEQPERVFDAIVDLAD